MGVREPGVGSGKDRKLPCREIHDGAWSRSLGARCQSTRCGVRGSEAPCGAAGPKVRTAPPARGLSLDGVGRGRDRGHARPSRRLRLRQTRALRDTLGVAAASAPGLSSASQRCAPTCSGATRPGQQRPSAPKPCHRSGRRILTPFSTLAYRGAVGIWFQLGDSLIPYIFRSTALISPFTTTFRHNAYPPAPPGCFLQPGIGESINGRRQEGTPADPTRTPRPLRPVFRRALSLPQCLGPPPLRAGLRVGKNQKQLGGFPAPEARVGVLLREWRPWTFSPLRLSTLPAGVRRCAEIALSWDSTPARLMAQGIKPTQLGEVEIAQTKARPPAQARKMLCEPRGRPLPDSVSDSLRGPGAPPRRSQERHDRCWKLNPRLCTY
ncbi:uncharacterized protein LOC143403388 [Callospermophilus lateralis]|uniref:uncharacterized protein LOC143403388 n=1 Tax=Callospermophilus lateralis TaxID=76772 RepID=UPI0040388475